MKILSRELMEIIDLKFWLSEVSCFINSTFFISNSKVSLFTPLCVPWVGHNPISCSILNFPTNGIDGMSSKDSSWGVLVDSWFVAHEILLNSESNFIWSVAHNFFLHGWNSINSFWYFYLIGLDSASIITFSWALFSSSISSLV